MSTLAMKDSNAEVRMKRQWQIRRQFQPTTDAERRWDRAYQHPGLIYRGFLPPDPSRVGQCLV
jgi:hypothetical protein